MPYNLNDNNIQESVLEFIFLWWLLVLSKENNG